MLTRFWNDYDNRFLFFDELQRRMNRIFEEFNPESDERREFAFQSAALRDEGDNLVLTADLPGMTEKDIKLSIANNVLTIAGERKIEEPDGYSVHRRERNAFRFSRSFSLEPQIDPARVDAAVVNGVLTVTLPKAEEAKPREIKVRVN